jgi:hypothetical protein
VAADRAIAVPPTVRSSWAFETHTTTAKLRPHQAVGFWQRSSGAKAGVGANFVSVMEYQLPEAAPARVRSASFQFSGKPAHLQCAGAEPVVIDVYAYAADGRADVNDARSGSRVAQLSADCSDKAAFAQPIDVTAIVRQQAVASGVRFVGFNIRKGNNRQGAGLFDLAAGKLTVVLADQALAQAPIAMVRPTPNPALARPVAPQNTYGMNAPERAMAAQTRAAANAPVVKPSSSAAPERGRPAIKSDTP